MAGFKVIPTSVSIPTNLTDFKSRFQYAWTASDSWTWKQSVSVNYGPAAEPWNSNTQLDVTRKSDLYNFSDTTGFQVDAESGGGEEGIYEMSGNSRWMPASVFNGMGFETKFQTFSNNTNHRLYMAAYALHFVHRTNTGRRYYGIDAGYNDAPGHNQYRYDYVNSNSTHTSTIRSWGPDWLLQGLLVSFKTATGGTGSTFGRVALYNLKFGNLYSTNSSSYRALPLNLRPYSGRNKHADSTNKFVAFK